MWPLYADKEFIARKHSELEADIERAEIGFILIITIFVAVVVIASVIWGRV